MPLGTPLARVWTPLLHVAKSEHQSGGLALTPILSSLHPAQEAPPGNEKVLPT